MSLATWSWWYLVDATTDWLFDFRLLVPRETEEEEEEELEEEEEEEAEEEDEEELELETDCFVSDNLWVF